MKLFICSECQDVVKCASITRTCECGASWGKYLDDLNAVYGGKAIPLGFDNYSLFFATQHQPQVGLGKQFTAFVIPKKCPTFKKIT
jgi:hypothetical protein